MPTEFTNEPLIDFTQPQNRRKMEAAITAVERALGKEYPLYIGAKKIKSPEKFHSYSPAHKDSIVGVFQKAAVEHAEQAVQAALRKFEEWKKVPVKRRVDILFRAAQIMRRRRFEINAWMIFEVGKNWVEADADTAEAIDFLEFYGREMLRLSGKQPLTEYPGERNELMHIPLGVGLILPPWNFPLAILTGMTSAAVVAGNTVVLKPSSDSPMMGNVFMEVMLEAGLPMGVVNFVTGSGGTIGDYIVAHLKIRFIAFTGSKEIGLHINELAAKTQPGQMWIKRVIAEMGGKDSIIIDRDANLDEAVAGVVASAYGFQGQKCSACSRVIVLREAYNNFVRKVAEKVEALQIGDPKTNHSIGPVINERAMRTILKYVERGVKEGGRLITGGAKTSGNGWYVQPTIIADVKPRHTISLEEIFGPVLAILKAKDFEDAMRIANNTEYGLTGSLYSTDREKINIAKRDFFVGNLYFNRKCTGALVGVHPFGGFNMSGTDSKAGGKDYLLLFTQAKAISEKMK